MRTLVSKDWYSVVRNKLNDKSSSKFELSINEILGEINANVQSFMQGFLGDTSLTCNVEYELNYDEEFSPILNIEYQQKIVDNKKETSFFHVGTVITKINGEEYKSFFISEIPEDRQDAVARSIGGFLQRLIFGLQYAKAVILPPARGALVGENYSMKGAVTSSCKMYDYFLRDYEEAMRIPRTVTKEDEESSFFVNRIRTLLHGELETEKGTQFLVLSNAKRIPLTSAASSVKELSPFLFYLKNWSTSTFSFCIEEPEAHLHPSLQIDLADLLAACRNKGMMFQMTTHSDYFVQRINQLLQIGKLFKENPEKYKDFQTRNKLNRRFFLKEEDVLCYHFYENEVGQIVIEKLKSCKNMLWTRRSYY